MNYIDHAIRAAWLVSQTAGEVIEDPDLRQAINILDEALEPHRPWLEAIPELELPQ